MFSPAGMPSTASLLSTYTSFAATAMLVRTVINEVQAIIRQLIPERLLEPILSMLAGLFGNLSSQMTLIIDEYKGLSMNEAYQSCEVYLSTRITPSIGKLKLYKFPREKSFSISINKGEKIIDVFGGIRFSWEFISSENRSSAVGYGGHHESTEISENRSILLYFPKKNKDMVMGTYLPHVLDRSKVVQEASREVRLYSQSPFTREWVSTHLDHPSTFDTLAMDPRRKKELIDDLDRFVKRREFYRRVGRAWKRGYLLYGPSGTGKSSLIAAMANYLKFDVYDLELTNRSSSAELRRLLLATTNRSILVIEDIDCSAKLRDRQTGGSDQNDSQLTLSGFLNFIDGLWSSCGDERIIVFTTNYKNRLDPALLRPGRMDMHIPMSYCTPCVFKILASNYHRIESHRLFAEIEGLLQEVDATPAEVAEELMISDDADIALTRLVEFLEQKKQMKCTEKPKLEGDVDEPEKPSARMHAESENWEEIKASKMDESCLLRNL